MAEKRADSEGAWWVRNDDTAIVYADGVDWQHHMLHDMNGIKVYGSAEDCRADNACVSQCGIVELEVKLRSWVQPQHLGPIKGDPE